MATGPGKIVLMGSGEFTATMVEVHKELIAALDPPHRAVFLDTPAGFQLNVDQISETAVQYFKHRVQHPLTVASFKSAEGISSYDAENAFHTLRQADFVLIGPGSPTYTVRQTKQSPIPDILCKRVEQGGCLVAASAAALTVGRYTLPVYEIYKVGEEFHWVDGMNILAYFGFDLVVVPHWNNAEGGTHDTRRCFMGDARFRELAAMLPEDVIILGLDEHTACIIDLGRQQVTVRGIGRVVVTHGDRTAVYTKGEIFTLGVLRGEDGDSVAAARPSPAQGPVAAGQEPASTFWDRVHGIERNFQEGIDARDHEKITSALLELDRAIWQGKQDRESDETISEAREILRDQMTVVGAALKSGPGTRTECLAPLVNAFLELRNRFRKNGQYPEADAIRDCLHRADIRIEDTPEGARWHIRDQ